MGTIGRTIPNDDQYYFVVKVGSHNIERFRVDPDSHGIAVQTAARALGKRLVKKYPDVNTFLILAISEGSRSWPTHWHLNECQRELNAGVEDGRTPDYHGAVHTIDGRNYRLERVD